MLKFPIKKTRNSKNYAEEYLNTLSEVSKKIDFNTIEKLSKLLSRHYLSNKNIFVCGISTECCSYSILKQNEKDFEILSGKKLLKHINFNYSKYKNISFIASKFYHSLPVNLCVTRHEVVMWISLGCYMDFIQFV